MKLSPTYQQSTNSLFTTKRLLTLAALVLATGIGYLLLTYWATNNTTTASTTDLIFCDAEKKSGQQFMDAAGQYRFGNAKTRSSEVAHSGRYSSKVNQAQPYGITYTIEQPKAKDRYQVSVWRYRKIATPNFLAISGTDKLKYYKQQTEFLKKDEQGWELLQTTFTVPNYEGNGNIKIYVYTSGEGEIFFDDLSIQKISDTNNKNNSNSFNPQKMQLVFKDKAFQKIKQKRSEALQAGFLISAEDDWAKGFINQAGVKVPVAARLKGDYLDHLKGEKWSFRIKVADPHAWNRFKTFSIQNPKAREYLNEWMLHQFFEKEDVLTPRYDFFELQVNNKNLGVYAYEEHFDKQLAEFKKRREGPIVRFTEDAIWQARKREFDSFGEVMHHPHLTHPFQAASPSAFKEKKTQNAPNLAAQFKIAQNLMHEYQYGLKPASQIFDINLLAKYYAIVDITKAYHGLFWNNQRFYYNPVSSKLEPIGYDGFSHAEPWIKTPFFAYGLNEQSNHQNFFKQLFLDKQFIEQYLQHLYQLSHPSYITTFLEDLSLPLQERQSFLQQETPGYAFSAAPLINNAKKIHGSILPFNELSVKAHIQEKTSDSLLLNIANVHALPLKITGFGTSKMLQDTLENAIWLMAKNVKQPPQYQTQKVPLNTQFVFYQLPGIDTTFHSSLIAWPIAQAQTPAQNLFEGVNLKSNALFSVKNKVVSFKVGSHQVSQNILIPQGYQVHIPAGTKLDFVQQAKFISHAPVFMYGTEEQPIKIYSSDKTANGFTILQAPKKSVLRYVVFENLNTLNYKGWTLTGAVSFYESEVQIDHCLFTKNHCEDALNIIRANFTVNHSTVSHTFSDGFDADFCTGTISNSYFIKTGNDCMDFSGSTIKIDNCFIQQSGDKGISVGEEANVSVISASIDGAIIGVASKDLSTLKIQNINLKNCTQGFAAYQKKPEFGGAKISVEKYTSDKVKHLYQIEPGSVLKLPNREIAP